MTVSCQGIPAGGVSVGDFEGVGLWKRLPAVISLLKRIHFAAGSRSHEKSKLSSNLPHYHSKIFFIGFNLRADEAIRLQYRV